MVGICSRFSGTRSHRREQSAVVDPSETMAPNVEEGGPAPDAGIPGIEEAVEFKPVEPPKEPVIYDQPVICPPPEPSILNDGRIWKERRSSATAMARVDLPVVKEGACIRSHDSEAKHHWSSSRSAIASSFSAPEYNIVTLLEECNASGSQTN